MLLDVAKNRRNGKDLQVLCSAFLFFKSLEYFCVLMCLETRWKLRKASFFPPCLSFLVVMMVEEIVIFHQGSEERECFYNLLI